jgi:hypothetical protein
MEKKNRLKSWRMWRFVAFYVVPNKACYSEYKTLFMKRANIDGLSNDKAKANFDLLCDAQILLGLVTRLPLL